MQKTSVIDDGLTLLSTITDDSLTVAEAVDRLELLTSNPSTIREILECAERQGIIEREDGTVIFGETSTEQDSSPESVVKVKDGDYTCKRCGRSLSTGKFVELENREMGPFGAVCVQNVLGKQ